MEKRFTATHATLRRYDAAVDRSWLASRVMAVEGVSVVPAVVFVLERRGTGFVVVAGGILRAALGRWLERAMVIELQSLGRSILQHRLEDHFPCFKYCARHASRSRSCHHLFTLHSKACHRHGVCNAGCPHVCIPEPYTTSSNTTNSNNNSCAQHTRPASIQPLQHLLKQQAIDQPAPQYKTMCHPRYTYCRVDGCPNRLPDIKPDYRGRECTARGNPWWYTGERPRNRKALFCGEEQEEIDSGQKRHPNRMCEFHKQQRDTEHARKCAEREKEKNARYGVNEQAKARAKSQEPVLPAESNRGKLKKIFKEDRLRRLREKKARRR